MGMLKKYLGIVFLLFCAPCCFARQISFQIVQHDDSATEVLEQSFVIEDSLLNGFFDDGYIVTNSSAEISDSEDQDQTLLKKGLGEAFNGYSDYFVQVKIYYFAENPDLPNKKNIEQVDWILAAANTGVTLNNNTFKPSLTKNKTDDLQRITSDLLTQIKKAIKA